MAKILIVILFSWALIFYHSCTPFGDQRGVLSLSRAEDDIIKDYTESFQTSAAFMTATKRCTHCGKLVESNISAGECMFRELTSLPEDAPGRQKLFRETRKQLRGEATSGYGPASFLLGFIAENGLFGTKPDIITAARQYRLFAESGAPEGKAALAAFWIRLGENLPAAIELLNRALEENPRNTDYYMYLSHAYTMLNKPLEAFETAKKAYYHSPVHSTERLRIEMIFVEKLMIAAPVIGKEAALAQINDMIYISPKNKKLIFDRANLYALFGDFATAEKELDSLKKDYPPVPLRIAKARLRAMQNNLSGAKQELSSLLAEDPENYIVRTAMLELLMERGKKAEAFETVNKFIESDKDKTGAYILRANLHLMNEDIQSAIADFELAKKTAPPAAADDIDQAIQSLKKAAEEPEFPEM